MRRAERQQMKHARQLLEYAATSTTSTVVLPDTTTSTSSTTTTTACHCFGCRLQVRLTSTEPLGALQFELDYSATSLRLLGSGTVVACTPLMAGAIVTSNNDEEASTLRVGVISLVPFSGPAVVVDCAAIAPNPIDADALVLTLIDASDILVNPATPTLAVASPDCFAGGPLLPSTTTTAPAMTTTTLARTN